MIGYSDIVGILQPFIEDSERKAIELTFDTIGAAVRWTQRANAMRVKDRKRNSAIYKDTPSHDMYNASIYDILTIKHPGRGLSVIIEKSGLFNPPTVRDLKERDLEELD